MLTEPRLHRTSAEVADEAHAILPVGAFEQHGPHLPLTTDGLIATVLADALAARVGGLLLPALPVSCSQEHAGFPGSLWLSAESLARVMGDLRASLERQGVSRLAIVNAHGGNHGLAHFVQEANLDGFRAYLGPGRALMAASFARAGIETDVHDDMHAGEDETSVMLAYFPGLVRDGAVDEVVERPLLAMRGLGAYSRSGVAGRPSLATAEKGRRVVEAVADGMAEEALGLFAGGPGE